ncbi:uncharacterized protein LOC142639773 [Castanea sativa]|uniref:uncharacterized protein LOC142639773 n=1 Tax=Castanea sativa TaxID=21020 RepID=UPI003F652E55
MNIEEQRTTAEPVEELEEVQLDDSRPGRTTKIGTLANQTIRQALELFLRRNQDVFAWSHEDIPGIDPAVIVHRLNVSPSFSPIRQKKRVFAPERDRAIAKEVRKLQEADFIREVYYPDWLANVVMVKKSNGKWRMCVDFTDLNRACPKDSYPLPRIDTLRGIEVNPEKVKAIMELSPPKTVKEVQCLTGKIAALNRFVSRATDKCLPFFRTLKKSFEWTDECQKAFEKLKTYLSAPPLLSPSVPGEELFLYLAVSTEAPRTAVKGQLLADFVAEFTTAKEQGAEKMPIWRIHTDGSSNKHAGGVGVVLYTPEGDNTECMICLDFPTTNNEAEYEALVAGLELTIAAGAKKAVVYSNSQIMTSQVNGNYDCKNERMRREENQEADRLAKAASAEPMTVPEQVLSFVQISSLLDDISMQAISNEECWTTPIMAYLKEGKLPDDKENARKLKVTAARFVLIKNVLYKRGFSRPYLRCLGREEADYVMREIHEGVCGNHSGTSQRKTSPLLQLHGHSRNGDWISWALYLQQ